MFGFSSPSRHRNYATRRTTPVLQCSVGRAQEVDNDSGISVNHGSAAAMAFPSLTNFFADPFKNVRERVTHNVKTVGMEINIKPVYFLVTLVAVVTMSTVMTLIFSTSGVTKGYVLRDLQTQRQALVRTNEQVTMEVAQAQALSTVTTNDTIAHMRPAKNIIFLSGSSAVAMK